MFSILTRLPLRPEIYCIYLHWSNPPVDMADSLFKPLSTMPPFIFMIPLGAAWRVSLYFFEMIYLSVFLSEA